MFTGIIEDKGKVVRVDHRGKMWRLTLEVPFDLTELQPGDSININGACLTVAGKRGRVVSVDLSPETIQRATFARIKEGDRVNLERALRLSDRLGGHIVTGHIDGTGVVTERRIEGDFLRLRIRIPEALMRYVVQKGSIAIDGISLTVNDCQTDWIQLTLIPYTLEKTTLIDKQVGDEVNVETDILGKYVERILDRERGTPEGIDLSFLKEHGFLDKD
jgi:riboflavin synthase